MGLATEKLKAVCWAKHLNYIGTRGNTKAPVCIVGEAPGADEDREGMPFMGASGRLLEKMLSEVGLDSSDCWFTNPFKVRPPDNDIDRIKEYGIPEDIFLNQFFEELFENKPQIIISLGATPTRILCPQTITVSDGKVKIGNWRGSLLSSDRLQWEHYVVPNYHPAFILRAWEERQQTVLCLAKAKEEFDFLQKNGRIQPLTPRELITRPSFDEAYEYLSDIYGNKLRTSIDIETRPWLHISFAKSRHSALSFHIFGDQESTVWSPEQTTKIWRLTNRILQTCKQIGQNYLTFDSHWLEYIGFETSPELVDDTMVRHHILWPELEHGLQFQTLQYTREPFYKEEGHYWRPKDGIAKIQLYNNKDTAVTFEICEEQEKEFDDRPYLRTLYETLAMPRQRKLFQIEKRGVLTENTELGKLRTYVKSELKLRTDKIELIAKKPVFACKDDGVAAGLDEDKFFNLGSGQQVIAFLKSLGLKIPKDRKTGKETTKEEHLQKLLASSNDPSLRDILDVRELNKMLGTYINCKLCNSIFYTSFGVTKTVTGRLGSAKNFLGFGSNGQNIPKHSALGLRFRKCLIARPGYIFIEVDQKTAEDWVVQAIIADNGGGEKGLKELRSGINRHKKLASFIFSKPESVIKKEDIEYYLGKKTRHAGNYDMHGETMSLAMAKEGKIFLKEHCDWFLFKFHEFDPTIKGVYHEWVKQQVLNNRRLVNPFGRERIFFRLRPGDDYGNEKVFREAYSVIPQSTVADNNGFATLIVEDELADLAPTRLDVHDALILEVPNDLTIIVRTIKTLQKAYHRTIVFPNGTAIEIPIDISLGWNLAEMTECADLTEIGLTNTLTTLGNSQKVQPISTFGVQPVLSAQL